MFARKSDKKKYNTCNYFFGKIISQKCKLNFMILQTNLVVGSINFIGMMNQVHYIDNQFNLNF